MSVAGHAHRGRVGIVDGPADVIVAAQVGHPGSGAGCDRQAAERLCRQSDVAGGQHRPDLHHQRVVIGNVADLAGMVALAQVVHQIRRTDDGLGLESQCRAGDPGQRS